MNTTQARMQRIATLAAGILSSQAYSAVVMAGMADLNLIVSAAEGINEEIERREDVRQQGAARRFASKEPEA